MSEQSPEPTANMPQLTCGKKRLTPLPGVAELHRLFDLDADNGLLRHRPRTLDQCASQRAMRWFNNVKAGKVCGHKRGNYLAVEIAGNSISAHWIVWAMVHGDWPSLEIDHINGDGRDNRPSNLRLATRQQNCQNTQARRHSRAGVKGVHFHKRTGKWQASICCDGTQTYLGLFGDIASASAAYQRAAEKVHGEFLRRPE